MAAAGGGARAAPLFRKLPLALVCACGGEQHRAAPDRAPLAACGHAPALFPVYALECAHHMDTFVDSKSSPLPLLWGSGCPIWCTPAADARPCMASSLAACLNSAGRAGAGRRARREQQPPARRPRCARASRRSRCARSWPRSCSAASRRSAWATWPRTSGCAWPGKCAGPPRWSGVPCAPLPARPSRPRRARRAAPPHPARLLHRRRARGRAGAAAGPWDGPLIGGLVPASPGGMLTRAA